MKISSSYWFWLSMLLAMWTAAAIEGQVYDSVGLYWGGAAYFACYFLISLTSDRPILLLSLLIACLFSAAVITVAVDFAEPGYGYLLLTHLIVVGYAFHQLPLRLAITAAVAALLTVLITLSYQEIRLTPVLFILGGLAAGMVAITYRQQADELRQTEASMDMQLSEYRELKRLRVQGEEAARHQERTRIARDMHDSVGHKLTALLMQLEVFRLSQSTDEAVTQQAEQLKRLAQESLSETRKAVMALNDQEPTGMQAIIQLIRKWENDHMLQTHFTVRQGVLSLALSNEQSIVIYRTLQEALTNAMRHGQRGTVEIIFEVLAGQLFRLEVTNPIAQKAPFKSGFGLKVMKERLQQIEGELVCIQTECEFIVRASFPIEQRGKENDPNIVGRGSEAGSPRSENDD